MSEFPETVFVCKVTVTNRHKLRELLGLLRRSPLRELGLSHSAQIRKRCSALDGITESEDVTETMRHYITS